MFSNIFQAVPNQSHVLKEFILKSSTQYPHFCYFLLIMMSTPANTSNVERSYSILEIICAPRRNKLSSEHLKILYLLSVMREEVGNVTDYTDCLRFIEDIL